MMTYKELEQRVLDLEEVSRSVTYALTVMEGSTCPPLGLATITLLDFFAGLMAPTIYSYPGCNLSPEDIAAEAYTQADAMLKEREK